MRFSIVTLTLALAVSATASPSLHKRIIGGGPVAENEMPFIAEFRNKRSPCTGFLIGPQTVMTAAHCLRDRTHTGLIYGSVDVGKGKPTSIAEFVMHPDYNSALQHHDIGLVFLSKKVTAKPAKILSPPQSYPKRGTKVLAAGYGVIKVAEGDNPPVYGKVLNKVQLNVEDKSTCLKHEEDFLGTHQFCTSDTPLGHAVCNGDSGGPVLYGEGKDQFVVGLINHGIGGVKCGEKGAFQYYTYIKPYLPWVDKETKRFLRDGPRT